MTVELTNTAPATGSPVVGTGATRRRRDEPDRARRAHALRATGAVDRAATAHRLPRRPRRTPPPHPCRFRSGPRTVAFDLSAAWTPATIASAGLARSLVNARTTPGWSSPHPVETCAVGPDSGTVDLTEDPPVVVATRSACRAEKMFYRRWTPVCLTTSRGKATPPHAGDVGTPSVTASWEGSFTGQTCPDRRGTRSVIPIAVATAAFALAMSFLTRRLPTSAGAESLPDGPGNDHGDSPGGDRLLPPPFLALTPACRRPR